MILGPDITYSMYSNSDRVYPLHNLDHIFVSPRGRTHTCCIIWHIQGEFLWPPKDFKCGIHVGFFLTVLKLKQTNHTCKYLCFKKKPKSLFIKYDIKKRNDQVKYISIKHLYIDPNINDYLHTNHPNILHTHLHDNKHVTIM